MGVPLVYSFSAGWGRVKNMGRHEMRRPRGHKGGTEGEKVKSEKKLKAQKKKKSKWERARASEGLLTQQELSAKAGVRQGASVCSVCVCVERDVGEIVATCQIQWPAKLAGHRVVVCVCVCVGMCVCACIPGTHAAGFSTVTVRGGNRLCLSRGREREREREGTEGEQGGKEALL